MDSQNHLPSPIHENVHLLSGRLLILVMVGWLTYGLPDAVLSQEKTSTSFVKVLLPEFEQLISEDAEVEVLADGFEWTEGPVWIEQEGYLLFTDIPNNRIYKWQEGFGVSIFMNKSGYTGKARFKGDEPGANGLTLDLDGHLCMCEHGNRQVTRLNSDATKTVLASHFDGKRFNSPNDLIFKSNGDLYFTDPCYGLPDRFEDTSRELDWCGVYRLSKGQVTLLTKEMTRPNGIAFSPDEKTLYVAQSDATAAIWKAFPVNEDGTVGVGKIFFDATKMKEKPNLVGSPDGMAVDQQGNLWATGPGGVLVFSPAGKLLGRIATGEKTANCCFGEDGSTLFIAADNYLCRVKTKTKGLGF